MAPPQWAYQVENYVTQPDEELVCSICRGVFSDPTLCPCDHVFCKACITKWLQSNRNCPICRKRASLVSIKQAVPIVKNLIMKLMLNCRNKTLGCTAQFSVESSEAHVKECQYELVQCKNKPCTDRLFRKDIAEHETKDCPHRAIRCKKCKCKIPTSSGKEDHNCIVALRSLVKERSELVLAKSARIKQLKAEVKNLKAKMKGSGRSRFASFARDRIDNSDALSISPDEITINIHEFDSSSSTSSDSDMSSDNFYILTNETFPDDGNEDSDSFSISMDNDVNVENENTRDTNEYRNAESQTVEPLDFQNDEMSSDDENTSQFELPRGVSVNDAEIQSQPRRPAKRRPTTQKPAKRRFIPPVLTSDDEDEHAVAERGETSQSSAASQSNMPDHLKSKIHSYLGGASSASVRTDHPNNLVSKKQPSYMEAGPSSAPVRSNLSDHSSTSKKWSHPRQKRAKQSGKYFRDNAVSSRIITPDNPVFQKTLALLEQHSLESDPEWLPEHARIRESDTTTESNSSYVVSSNSELSDVDSLDDSHHELPPVSDFMNWMFESTSEEDLDWRPPASDEEDSL